MAKSGRESWPWISNMLVHSFCCRATSSKSFDFFVSLQLNNKYISNILSIYVYINRFHWILLSIEIDRARVVVLDSLRKPKEDYQDLIAIMQKAWARFLKRHIGGTSTVWSLFQTWLSGMNTYRTSTVIFFKHHEYFITHLYIVFETEPRKQPMCMWAHALFLGGTKRMTQQEFDVHITLIIISFI